MLTQTPGKIWDGWYFKDKTLIDEYGNRYTLAAIRAVHFEKQMHDTSKLLIHSGCKGCKKAH